MFVLGRAGHGLIVGAIDDGDGGTLAGDAVDPGLGCPGWDVDRGVEAEQLRHPCHGAAVVAVGRGREGEWHERVELATQIVDGFPRRETTDPFVERAVDGPGCAEDLEGGQAEAARFILEQHRSDTEFASNLWRVDEWRFGIAGELAVEFLWCASGRRRRCCADGWVGNDSGGLACGHGIYSCTSYRQSRRNLRTHRGQTVPDQWSSNASTGANASTLSIVIGIVVI
jgi:hypothetical protein